MPDIIVITTNRSPHDWYDYSARDDEKNAVFRRITGAYRFDKHPSGMPHSIEVDINDPLKFMIKQVEPVCASCDNKKSQCSCPEMRKTNWSKVQ